MANTVWIVVDKDKKLIDNSVSNKQYVARASLLMSYARFKIVKYDDVFFDQDGEVTVIFGDSEDALNTEKPASSSASHAWNPRSTK